MNTTNNKNTAHNEVTVIDNIAMKKESTADKVKYYENGGLHRDDGTTIKATMYSKSGNLKTSSWVCDEEKQHCEVTTYSHNKSSEHVVYSVDGQRVSEKFYEDGKLHRVGQPACIFYNGNGGIDEEQWYKNGKLHRNSSAAHIVYGESGNIEIEHYYEDGVDKTPKI